MKFHEYANIYRLLPEAELQKLADDIKGKGQLLPITSYEGKVLDGRNRFNACMLAGVEPRIEPYEGDDPLGLIASLNDHRRHDTEAERALVGARMANLRQGAPEGNKNAAKSNGSTEPFDSKPAVSITRAAELSGSTPASIKRAKPIVTNGIPALQDMAETGEVSIRAASVVAKLPKDEQEKAVSGGISGVIAAAKNATAQPAGKQAPTPPQKVNLRGKKVIESNGMAIFASAKCVMDTLSKDDTEWRQCLEKMAAYCNTRIKNNY
jgi:hypothetical protein